MSLRHRVFATCAEQASDPHMQDVYIAMAYGMFPFCVSEDPAQQCLWFRRSTGPAERDKTQRLADAAAALQASPDVVWYNETLGAAAGAPLHVQPVLLAVMWLIPRHDAATHARMVPALLAWTCWTRDAAWRDMRQSLAAGDAAPCHPRHVRTAQIIDFVGARAQRQGKSDREIAALCREALHLHGLGQLRVDADPETGAILDVA